MKIITTLAAISAVFCCADASFLTNKTEKFKVDGSSLPDFPFDLGESYAGLLPISSNKSDPNQFWFWFVPSTNPVATNEVLVWLEGGPGCSSMIAMFYENGPFLWQFGTIEPSINPWSWTNLTNVLWIDQPIGTGYSTGTPTITGEEGLSKQFLGFWKNFIKTFELYDASIYLVGESYGGRYIPYIGNAMLDKNDTRYYNLQSTLMLDALIADHTTQQTVGIVPYVEHYNTVFNLNDTFMDTISHASDVCGLDAYVAENYVFPGNPDANTTLPSLDNSYTYNGIVHNCSDLINDITTAITRLNPCYTNTHITNSCPTLFSSIGYPTFVSQGVNQVVSGGLQKRAYVGEIYLNRQDVKTALNAPSAPWLECNQFGISPTGSIYSPQPIFGKLPSLIERSNRTIIAHGSLDMLVTVNGTLLALQNMTWGGKQGFSKPPSDDFQVPVFSEPTTGNTGPAGSLGATITERGLTFVEIYGAGHLVAEFAPTAVYRQLEFLLGRVDSLGGGAPFTTDPNQ